MASTAKMKIDLRAYLLADTAITALIAQRLYAVHVEAELAPAMPYVVMGTTGGSGNYAHDGATGNDDVRVQFSIYASTSAELEQVRDAIKDRMDILGGTQQGNTVFGHVFFDNDVDTYESESTRLKSKAIDFRLMIRTVAS